PSALSEDRRTVSAVVHHLSTWTDITGGLANIGESIGNAWSDVADWGYYQVGNVFDVRVDEPTCSGKPSWVDSTTFIATQRNISLLFCTGVDAQQPHLVVAKVRVNRGFAFQAHIKVPTSW